jgi:electron transfer flavoprotein alpha subunit
MSGILLLAEHDGGVFKKTAFELAGKAAELAKALGTTVSAVVLGDAPAADLGGYGVAKVYQVKAAGLGSYDPVAITDALAAAVKSAAPDVILAPASYLGKDALPRLVARLGTGMASECTDLRAEGGAIVGRRPMYAGKLLADVRVTGSPAVFTVRPNSFLQPVSTGAAAEVVAVAAEVHAKTQVVERKTSESAAVDLTEAERIVSGGRSLKDAQTFDQVIRPMGAAIGAAVGASRAAVDAGIAHHAEQVGQTGKTVNPTLYFAVGISGAIQHLAGMRTSKVIVAINKDAEAPIFEHATYGIVGDLFEIAPKLTEELKKALA